MQQADEASPDIIASDCVEVPRSTHRAGMKAARAGSALVPGLQPAGSGFEAQLEAAVEAVQQAVHESAAATGGAHEGEAVAAECARQMTISASAEVTQARERAVHGMETMMKTAEDVIAFGQGNFEALLKSSQIWATGIQDLSKQMAATVQANLDETMTSFKAFSGVKSLKDAMDLQAQFARVSMEKTLAETGRLTDASLKLTEQALAPITARVTLAVETMVKPA